MINATRIAIGIAMNAYAWFMFALNMLCIACILRGRLWASPDTTVYIITGYNLLAETGQLLVHMLYVGPMVLFDSWLFESRYSLGVTIASTWLLGVWYLGSLIQILMATNRLAVVFFPRRAIFTRPRLYFLIALFFFIATVAVIYSQLISPCCRITPDHVWFTYTYLFFENQTINYSSYFVDLPLDTTTSLICVTSYVSLFFYIFRMGKSRHGHLAKKEIRLCIQCLIMFLTYTVTWGTFFVAPAMNITTPEICSFTTFVMISNCGVNSITYLSINKEIRHEVRKIFGFSSQTKVSSYHVSQTSFSGSAHNLAKH